MWFKTKLTLQNYKMHINYIEVAIGPVTGRTLYPVVTCFSMFTHLRVTFIAFLSFSIVLWCRPFTLRSYISFSCSVFYGKTSS